MTVTKNHKQLMKALIVTQSMQKKKQKAEVLLNKSRLKNYSFKSRPITRKF